MAHEKEAPITEVLHCRCGACQHWRIVRRGDETFLECMSCPDTFPITKLEIPAHDKLHWVERKQHS